ncbi:tautomerase family protein [Inquilinus sp.]|jgi:hypothetical protein|uniref:tautomerase family protein n=1 Tax=Inquilinus sp. TaxID=1932117 RepID=UPI0037848AF9
MPLTRISLARGKPPDYLRALSDSLHRALVEASEVPPDDRFQIIHQHEPRELVFDGPISAARAPMISCCSRSPAAGRADGTRLTATRSVDHVCDAV